MLLKRTVLGYDPYLGASSLEEGNVEGYALTDMAVMFEPSDVLMLWDGERSGLVGHNLRGVVSSTVQKLTPSKEITGTYLYYHLLFRFDWIQGRRTGTGVPHVPKDLARILNVKYPLNTIEQESITSILVSIDKAIEKTESLIAKYQQIKAGLMHDLFTRGVTADGKLRPPREQAPELYKETQIGWIPKDWEVSTIDSLLDRVIDYRGKTPAKTVSGIRLITAKNVRPGYVDPEPMEFIAERDYAGWMTRGIPNAKDILFTTEAPLGNVAQIASDEKLAFAQRVIILQVSDKAYPVFIKYLLMSESGQRAVLRLATGTTALGVKQSEFRKIQIPYPIALEEQRLIAKTLCGIEDMIGGEQKVKNKLLSKKYGLMHDLLTGKVRVNAKLNLLEDIA